MLEDKNRTIGYICPKCHQSVLMERNEFQLMSGPVELSCPCGGSAVTVSPEGDHVTLTVPCLYCGQDHTVSCSSRAFLTQKALAFSCLASGLDCCYVGEAKPVFEAMARLEEAADKLDDTATEQGAFLDEFMMHEVLSELKEIAGRDGVSCTCGSHKWTLKIGYSALDLTCTDCGGTLRIPAATASDLDDICCKNKLVIKGKGR
ncbi:MAG: hypothetical protein RSC82_01580 [Oscillospiraceae bacterium]